jgi:hypothetical protein
VSARAAVALIAAHETWHAVLTRATELVAASRRGNPALDLPSDHALAPVLRSLKAALRDGSVVIAPMPHFQHRRFQAEQDKVSRLVKLRRKSRRTEEDEAQIERLRRELNPSGEAA